MINSKFIKVKDLYFIFNTNKTAWIAVTESALPFCKEYIENSDVNEELLSEDELELYKGLLALEEANNQISEREEAKSCYLHITQHCNLQCPYCYSKNNMRNAFEDKPYAEWKIAIDKLVDAGFSRLIFSGGEPLLHKDLEKILEYCSYPKFKEIDLISNGLLIDKKNINFLKRLVTNLCISLDGYSEKTNANTRGKGTFQKVVSNIEKLRNHGVPVNIIATIYRENIQEINNYLQLAHTLDCTISFSLFTLSGEALNNQQLLQTDMQMNNLSNYLLDDDTPQLLFDNIPVVKGIQYREGCGAGNYLVSVNADGAVYPCHFMMIDNLTMGNIFLDDMDTIVQNGYMHSHNMNIRNIEECTHCDYRFLCGGGCRAHTYTGNDAMKKSEDCQFYKTYYDKIISQFS